MFCIILKSIFYFTVNSIDKGVNLFLSDENIVINKFMLRSLVLK